MSTPSGQPRILVTGSRHWTDAATIRTALTTTWRRHGRPITVVHGACRTGADPTANAWAHEHALHGIHVEAWPANWARHGRAAGPLRNIAMLNSAPGGNPITEVLAFPLGDSPGTRGTIHAAHTRGIPVTEWTGPQIVQPPHQPPGGLESVGQVLARLGFRPGARR